MALCRMADGVLPLLLHARAGISHPPTLRAVAVATLSALQTEAPSSLQRAAAPRHWHAPPHSALARSLLLHSGFATKSDPKADKKALLISELPDAKDCDEVLGDYDNLRSKYARISYPPTYKPWPTRLAELSKGAARLLLATARILAMTPVYLWRAITMPAAERSAKLSSAWSTVKHEAGHYWMGLKLLAYETRIAAGLATKALGSDKLTRRERRQLTRTAADLFRLVPMIVIVLIPFLELALPVLLRLFPNMLPSTFEDKLKKEEQLKKQLVVKLELARFLQDTVVEMAQDISKANHGDTSATAAELVQFMTKVRAGESISSEELLRFAPLFKDELTLDNLSRMQLVSMCQFVGIAPFGTDAFLRTRLRVHLDKIKQDDRAIKDEGIESLTADELRQACRDRGLRAPYGEGAVAFMRRQLDDWLKLSMQRGLPSSLLLLSRAFTITTNITRDRKQAAEELASIRDTLSVLPDDVVEEVELQALSTQAAGSGAQALQNKMELLKREQELIEEEAEEKRRELEQAAAAQALSATASLITTPGGLDPKLLMKGQPGVSPDGLLEADMVVSAAKQALIAEGLSEEEAAARLAAAKEARMKAVVEALTVLASTSGVSNERALFMDIVKKEMARVNQVVAKQRGSSQLSFSAGSLQAKHVDDAAVPDDAGSAAALAKRVDRIIHRLEAELDWVEAQIGDKLHVLDTDKDGLISKEELEQAVRFLKAQIGEDELRQLLERLNAQHEGSQISIKELLALAAEPPTPSSVTPKSRPPSGGPAPSS